VNVDQEPLDFEPWALPGAGGGIKGSTNGRQECNPSWFRRTAWSALLQRVQRRMDGGPHSALLRMPLDVRHRRSVRRSSLDRGVLRDLPRPGNIDLPGRAACR